MTAIGRLNRRKLGVPNPRSFSRNFQPKVHVFSILVFILEFCGYGFPTWFKSAEAFQSPPPPLRTSSSLLLCLHECWKTSIVKRGKDDNTLFFYTKLFCNNVRLKKAQNLRTYASLRKGQELVLWVPHRIMETLCFLSNVVWTQIFLNTEKKTLRFRKYPATCGRSNTIQKRYVWTQVWFLNTEEKISVFENTRLRLDEA